MMVALLPGAMAMAESTGAPKTQKPAAADRLLPTKRPAAATSCAAYGPGFVNFTTGVTQPVNVGRVDYDALLIGLNKRFSHIAPTTRPHGVKIRVMKVIAVATAARRGQIVGIGCRCRLSGSASSMLVTRTSRTSVRRPATTGRSAGLVQSGSRLSTSG